MRRIAFILFSIFAIPSFSQETIVKEIRFDNADRSYRLHLPPNFDPTENLSLVFNLHGFTSNALEQEVYSGMDAISDNERFLVCYPDGIDNAWNVGWAFGSTAEDVGFISALIDELVNDYNVNPKKVYSCGMSNGGFMSYRLACELNDRIAAVASVTGSFVPEYLPLCNAGKAVPIFEIHGTADNVVPYEGVVGVATSIADVIDYWTENNNCTIDFLEEELADSDPNDASTVTKFHYQDCDDDTEVLLYRINNGGHTWPGSAINIGVTNQDINASQEIWDFFNRHSLEINTGNNDQLTSLNYKVFPNPVFNSLELNNWNGEVLNYKIYNTQGAVVSNGLFENNLNVSHLHAGIFLMKLESKLNSQVIKFIKN